MGCEQSPFSVDRALHSVQLSHTINALTMIKDKAPSARCRLQGTHLVQKSRIGAKTVFLRQDCGSHVIIWSHDQSNVGGRWGDGMPLLMNYTLATQRGRESSSGGREGNNRASDPKRHCVGSLKSKVPEIRTIISVEVARPSTLS